MVNCDFCGEENAEIHAMVDGNDVTVCSEGCIEKYSKKHPSQHITIIDRR